MWGGVVCCPPTRARDLRGTAAKTRGVIVPICLLHAAVCWRAAHSQCQTGGCSAGASAKIQLAEGIWMCGDTATTTSWQSVWSMCNECNNYHLPTVQSLSLRMKQTDVAGTWISSTVWQSATTEARRQGYGWAITGQPAGYYGGGGWTSVEQIDQGVPSTVSLAQLSLSNAITHQGWLSMTDGQEVTTNTHGDDGHPDHSNPSAEDTSGRQFWISLCVDTSGQPSPVDGSVVAKGGPYNGTYAWHHLWRKTVCTAGLTLQNSPTVCSGYYRPNNAAVCTYTCNSGFHVYGTRPIEGRLSDHQHTCRYDQTGTSGVFSGGKCVPDDCEPSVLANSPTNCSGIPLSTCQYTCDPGYASSGEHTCNLDGRFQGGSCVPLPCTEGLTLDNSPSICSGSTSDECDFVCSARYKKLGSHVCTSAGTFAGGSCIAIPGCDNVPWSQKRFDACGVCGGDNSTCAGCDGVPHSAKRWDSCGRCAGTYVPSVSIVGQVRPLVVTCSQELTIEATGGTWDINCPESSRLQFHWAVSNSQASVPLGVSQSTPTLRIPKNVLKGGTTATFTVTVTSTVEEGELAGQPARPPPAFPWLSISKPGDAIRPGFRSEPNYTSPAWTGVEPQATVCQSMPSRCPRQLVKIADTATTNITVQCLREPLIANIRGGNRAVSHGAVIVLDGSDTLDPEDPRNTQSSVAYEWGCYDISEKRNCTLGGVPVTGGPVWTIGAKQAASLTSNRKYRFSMVATKDVRRSPASVEYFVAPGAIPSVNINQRDIRLKYNFNERLVVTGEVDVARDDNGKQKYMNEVVNMEWSAERSVNGNWTRLVLASVDEMKLPWDDVLVSRGLASASSFPIATRVSISTARQTQCACTRDCRPPIEFTNQAVCSRYLVVNPYSLVSGSRYRFTLTGAGAGGNSAFAQVEIVMNLVPVGGVCDAKCYTAGCASWNEGMAVRDEFRIYAGNWIDEDQGTLWYRFGYTDHRGKQHYLTDFSIANSISAIIPAGVEESYFVVRCTCMIRDQYGGTAHAEDSVVIKPYVSNGNLAATAGSMLNMASSNGDTQKMFQLVDAFGSTLNSAAGRRRHRRQLNAEQSSDNQVARAVLVDNLAQMSTLATESADTAGRIGMSIAAVSAAPDELSTESTDKALSAVTNITDGSTLAADAVNSFADVASNLLGAAQGQFMSARRRRLNEGNATVEDVTTAMTRSNAIRNILHKVATGSTADKVAGEDTTVITTTAFGLETQRLNAAEFVNMTLAGDVQVPAGFLGDTDGPVDSQVTSWKGDSNPFFWAGTNDSNASLTSEVMSVSFNSLNGSELTVNGLAEPFIVSIRIPGGTECPMNSSCIPQHYNCSYFDDATGAFVIDGVEFNRTNDTIVCGFYHLTDLAAVAGPAPSFNTVDVNAMLSADFIMNNPVGFIVVCVLFAGLIAAFWWSLRSYFQESTVEGVVVNNADVMQTEFALYQTNYKVDKSPSGRGAISLTDRMIIKLRMDWDWGGLFYPMPGDPNTRAQRCLVLLAATLFTLLFEILFFKDPEFAVNFCEGESKNEPPCFTYDCPAGEAFEECDEKRRSEVCDPVCPLFTPNGYTAAIFAALCSIPFSRSMGYAFGWLQEPYTSVIDGDDAAGPGCLTRCWRRMRYGKQFAKELAAMEKPSDERTPPDIESLVNLMMKQPLFEGVQTNHDRRQIARVIQSKKIAPQAVIFECGDIGREVYSILRGTVGIKLPQPNGETRPAGRLSAPEYFGERAFKKGNGQERTATIETLNEEVHVLTVKGDDLDQGVLRRLVASVLPHDDAEFGYEDGNKARQRWKSGAHKLRSGHRMAKHFTASTGAKSSKKERALESAEVRSPDPDDVETSDMLFDPNDLLLSVTKLWHTAPRLTAKQDAQPSLAGADSDVVRAPELAEPLSDETQPAKPRAPSGAAPRNGRHRLSTEWKREKMTETLFRTTSVLGREVSVDLAQRQGRQPAMVDEGRGTIEIANPCRRLSVVRATALRNADKIGKSDPYAVVYFDDRRVGQTKTVKNTLDPRWDADFELLDVDKESKLKIMVSNTPPRSIRREPLMHR
jgi:hypothetical protein